MYFCALGIVFLLPVAYLICQVLTFAFYEGRWRMWCLVPIPLVIAGLAPLFLVRTPGAVTGVILGASTIGMVALFCVWGLYCKSARAAEEQSRTVDNGGEVGA